jgi:ubiquinone/menaquinone biosynthesis C-methylase UbiE
MTQNFDFMAENYDRWYDRPEGRAVFSAELKCIGSICECCRGSWLEVGVGTGRFAYGLQIQTGVDPSLSMLKIARERGIAICAGYAEDLPFPSEVFDGVLLALALCFFTNPLEALRECVRILRRGGVLLAGIIPADSSWGRAYNKKKDEGHPIYRSARFLEIPEILKLFDGTGLRLNKAASTLFWRPEEPPETDSRILEDICSDAGFVALLYTKKD